MEKKENRLTESLITVGGLLLIAGAAVYVTGWEFSPYFYLVGSIMFAVGQFSDRYMGDDPIMKRLRFQQVLGACFILMTGFLMFSENYHLRLLENPAIGGKLNSFLITVTRRNNWIVTLSIGAIFELYSSFRMDNISRKSE